jgi:ATP-dependent exoDNAse (exonuclease V) beta subunit
MSDLRASDADARTRALDVTCSFIVQAPAGSGKTELLTQRFLALLATVERPESVLAITFTRKAAAEMRNRILGALRAVGVPDLERGLLERTRDLARAVLKADAARGWGLLDNPNRLRLQTIDALNQGLARRLPVLCGLGTGLGVEEDARELYVLAAGRLLAHLPAEELREADAVAVVLAHVDNNVAKFVSLVAEMLARREAWLPELPGDVGDAQEDARTRTALEAARAALVRGHLTALARAFPMDALAEACSVARAAAEGLRSTDVVSPLRAWEAADQIPSDDPSDIPLWHGLARLFVTNDGTARRQFDKRIGIPPADSALKARAVAVGESLEAMDDLVELLAAVPRLPGPVYDDAEWRVLKALFYVLRLAAAQLQIVFAERKAADYPQFAAAARQALGADDEPTDTALALDATLRHVLVDEFQDTSEAQVRLLEQLTTGWEEGDGRTVFLVGDPMQSVYRFRHAEVALFLNVRDRGLGRHERRIRLEPLRLRVNFRSTDPLVDWVNDCFEKVLPAHDDELRGAVQFSASVSREGAGTDGGVRIHAFLRRSQVHEAERVAEIVRERLATSADARIAVLVQGRSHLIHVVAELARQGIDFHATDIDPLGERPAVLDALSLTRALAHLADRPSWLAVLRAPWCGLTLAQLHELVGDDANAAVVELLREERRRARLDAAGRRRLESTLAVLEVALRELRRHGLRDTAERAWLALSGPATLGTERELDEVGAYFDHLSTVERRASGPVDLAQLTEALAKLYAPSRPAPGTRVELLTIHKAKGLQFDTVIVPGLERMGRADERRLLQWMKLADRSHANLIVAPLASVGDEPNPLYAWLETLEKERLRQERRRLLYVAATRAERWLHLLGTCRVGQDRKSGAPRLLSPASSTGLAILWPQVEPEFARRLAEIGAIPGEEETAIPRDPPLRKFPEDWSPADMPAGPTIASSSRSRGPETAPVEFDWASETARHVGTVVHRELQRLASDGARTGLASPLTLERYALELGELGVPADRRAAAVDRVRDALARALDDDRGRWLLDPGHRDGASELALSGSEGGEFFDAVIDRTFIDAAGTRWIVDYKTSAHEGAGLDAFLDNEQFRYRPQLERYARLLRQLGPEPIRVGLYFPLLAAWREWLPE